MTALKEVYPVIQADALGILGQKLRVVQENRKQVAHRDIIAGLALQFMIVLVLLKIPPIRNLFGVLNRAVVLLEASTRAGSSFVFGYLGGAPLPFTENAPGASFVFALQALPVVLVVSALSSLFFYWRVLPVLVQAFSWMLQKTMRIGGAVGLSAAANIFLGMVESPLFIPLIHRQHFMMIEFTA